MTDPETADRTYIGPMTLESVEEIIAKVQPAYIDGGKERQQGSIKAIFHLARARAKWDERCCACRSAQMQCCLPWVARLH